LDCNSLTRCTEIVDHITTGTLDISHILSRLLSSQNISEAGLGRKISVPRATINGLASGRTTDPRASTLQSIANYFKISVDQLLGTKPLHTDSEKNIVTIEELSIPIIEWDQLHDWRNHIEKIKPSSHLNWISMDPSAGKCHFGLTVKGDAMWPQFQENTTLLINCEKDPKNRDFVIVKIHENSNVIFRQLILERDYKLLKPINSMFPSARIEEGDHIIGTVIQARNNL